MAKILVNTQCMRVERLHGDSTAVASNSRRLDCARPNGLRTTSFHLQGHLQSLQGSTCRQRLPHAYPRRVREAFRERQLCGEGCEAKRRKLSCYLQEGRMMEYKFINKDYSGNTITFEFNEESFDGVVQTFKNFLVAVGFGEKIVNEHFEVNTGE